MREHGHLGLVLIDASELAQVEHDYASRAFEQVLSAVSGLVSELQGAEVRTSGDLQPRRGGAFFRSRMRRAASSRAATSASRPRSVGR